MVAPHVLWREESPDSTGQAEWVTPIPREGRISATNRGGPANVMWRESHRDESSAARGRAACPERGRASGRVEG